MCIKGCPSSVCFTFQTAIMDVLDHKNVDMDVPYFADKVRWGLLRCLCMKYVLILYLRYHLSERELFRSGWAERWITNFLCFQVSYRKYAYWLKMHLYALIYGYHLFQYSWEHSSIYLGESCTKCSAWSTLWSKGSWDWQKCCIL